MQTRIRNYWLMASCVLAVGIGCASQVGRSVDVPQIPAPEAAHGKRARLNATVSIAEIKDVRGSVVETGDSSQRYTIPEGNVGQAVQTALAQAFTEKGITVSGGAPVSLWGEVRKWRTLVTTTTTSNIASEAALYIEVQDGTGRSLYSGTYHGSRSSQFPVSSSRDVQDSLALAMSQAITQLLDDEEFLSALWKAEGAQY